MTFPLARQKDCRHVSPVDGSKPKRSPALGGWAGRRAGVPGRPAVSATRRRRQSKRVAEIAENAGIEGNEVLECSRVTGKSLAEIAEIRRAILCSRNCPQLHCLTLGAVQTRVRTAIPTLRQMCPRRSRHTGEANEIGGARPRSLPMLETGRSSNGDR